jgi:hypothetical protein
MLSQTLTPDNLPLQQLLSQAQQMAFAQGLSAAQGQLMGIMFAARQVATNASVMAFDDVFRVTAVVTLLAILPALFMQTKKQTSSGPRPIIAD